MPVRIETVDARRPTSETTERAAELVRKSEVIVCPTDTGYAFTANGLDERAVRRVFELKGRDYSKPIHVAVHSLKAAEKYARVNKIAEHLARRFLPGGLTLVLQKKEIVPSLLVAGLRTVGIRIPDNRMMLVVAKLTDLPLTATSANISGQPTPYSVAEVIAQMGKDLHGVALVLDAGPLPVRELSTIVDLTVSPPRLLREGKIKWADVLQAIESFQE